MTREKTPQPGEAAEAPTSVDGRPVEPFAATDLPVPPAAPETTEQKPAEPDDGKKTVDQWADVLFPSENGRQHNDLWKHGAAAQLHGWSQYAHDANTPLRLTREDYEAAIAAATTVDASGSPRQHAGAVGRIDAKEG